MYMAQVLFVTLMLMTSTALCHKHFVEKMSINDATAKQKEVVVKLKPSFLDAKGVNYINNTKPFHARNVGGTMLDPSHKVAEGSAPSLELLSTGWLERLTGSDETFNIMGDLQHPVSSTGPEFVGVTLDLSFMRREWRQFNLTSKSLHSLATGLAPSILRVGGTAANFLIFDAATSVLEDNHDGGDHFSNNDEEILGDSVYIQDKNFTINVTDWIRLNELASIGKWDLIFDLNEFLRYGDAWDPDNAHELLKFSQAQGYKIPCFQLGNEPNDYYEEAHRNISAAQLVKDMQTLKSLLSQFQLYHNSCIVGPEVTKVTRDSASSYLREFLLAGGQQIVSAVTLHHYYFSDEHRRITIDDFMNPFVLDTLKEELSIGTSIAHTYAPSLPVWLSETSSVTGVGLPGVTDGFVAGFMWLDKLGLSALYGLQAVLRQSFYHGSYPLVADDYTPNPDYYLTLLFKRLVQGPVFNVTGGSEKVRAYMQCANRESYPSGSLTLYALNIDSRTAILNLTQFMGHLFDLYLLTPGDQQGLTSKFVALNGKKLEMVDEELPPLLPLSHQGPVAMAPRSFAFIVIPHANLTSCL